MRHKSLLTYIDGDMVCIEFNTGPPDMVGKVDCSDILLQVGVNNVVSNVL